MLLSLVPGHHARGLLAKISRLRCRGMGGSGLVMNMGRTHKPKADNRSALARRRAELRKCSACGRKDAVTKTLFEWGMVHACRYCGEGTSYTFGSGRDGG